LPVNQDLLGQRNDAGRLDLPQIENDAGDHDDREDRVDQIRSTHVRQELLGATTSHGLDERRKTTQP
jgi:hypothetical protein